MHVSLEDGKAEEMGKRARAALLAVAAAVTLAGSAAAQSGSRPQLLITRADADMAAETLLIEGQHFVWANDDQTAVILAGSPLAVHTIGETHILAQLPPGLSPGGYLLKVSRGAGAVQNDTFALTVGAVGPQGPEGPQGPMGDTGPQGLQGPQGEKGDTGAKGEPGPQGPKGLNWRGAWDTAVEYQTDDAVGHQGSSWLALRPSTAVPPAAGGDWSQIAAKGEKGNEGQQGPQGETGPQGPQGMAGPQGLKGDKGDKGDPGPAGPPGEVTALELAIELAAVTARIAEVESLTAHLPLWARRFGGPHGDSGSDVAVDRDGNVIVTGSFAGTVNFGGKPLASADDFGFPSHDVFVAKYSKHGAHLWSHRFGAGGDDFGTAVAVDPKGDVVVTGVFRGAAHFGGGTLGSTNSGDNIFVAKYLGEDGSHLWSRSEGGNGDDIAGDVAVDSIGNVILAGSVWRVVLLPDGTVDTRSNDLLLVKYSSTGSHQWSEVFATSAFDAGFGVATDADDNVFVTGVWKGKESTDAPERGVVVGDVFVAKYSAKDASQLWFKSFNGAGRDVGADVMVASNGNVLVTGSFEQAVNFGGETLTSAGLADVFLAEYSSGGSHVASRRLGGSGSDSASRIAVASGDVLITGSFQDAVELEGAAALGSAGLSDIFLIAYAADAAGKHSLGSLLWSRRYGGGDQDLASGLAVERATPGSPGSLLLTGSYAGTSDFGGGPLASAGSTDVFLLRLRP